MYALARGGQAAAAAFLERSAELTLDPARRAGRALAAAEASYLAGSGEDALRLAGVAERGPWDEFDRVRVDVLRGRVAMMQRRVSDAAPLLLGAARRLERFDRRAARDTYRDAFISAFLAGSLTGEVGLPDVAAAIRSAAPSADPPSVTDELLDAAALLVDAGYAAGAARAQRALAAFRVAPISRDEELQWLFLASQMTRDVYDEQAWDALSARILELVRETGVLAPLPMAAAERYTRDLYVGDLTGAAVYVAEQDRLLEAVGGEGSPVGRAQLAAFRGPEREMAQLDEATTRHALSRGHGIALDALHWAKAVLYNGVGRYDEALTAAQPGAAHPPAMTVYSRMLGELVEAAARCGRPEAAADAGELYRQAIDRLGRTRIRSELARAYLLYGEWLRREGRRVDARQQLRTAHEMLTAIGMTAFAERARVELAATGEKVRKRAVQTRDDLTAQERQVAGLARDGLSNPEIAVAISAVASASRP